MNTTPTKQYIDAFVLDRHESGYWVARWHNATYPLGRNRDFALAIVRRLNEAHRPNLEIRGNSLYVCWNAHDKGDKCTYELLVKHVA